MRQPGRSAVCAGKNGREAVKPPVRKVLALSRTFVYTRVYHIKATPHNSKCRYGERGAAVAKPKAQIILDAAKVSAASGGNSEPKQGQRSQSARGFCPRSTMRVPQPDIIEHFGNADAVPQPPERCLSRKAGIMRCCPKNNGAIHMDHTVRLEYQCSVVTCGGTNRCPPVQNPSASPNAGANAGTVPKSR